MKITELMIAVQLGPSLRPRVGPHRSTRIWPQTVRFRPVPKRPNALEKTENFS